MEFSEYFNIKWKLILDSLLLEGLFLLLWEEKYIEKNFNHSWMMKDLTVLQGLQGQGPQFPDHQLSWHLWLFIIRGKIRVGSSEVKLRVLEIDSLAGRPWTCLSSQLTGGSLTSASTSWFRGLLLNSRHA